jgi:hypothetical protein
MAETLSILKRLTGPALVAGGLLWVAMYADMIIMGLMSGKAVGLTPTSGQPLLTRLYFLLLRISVLVLSVGLLGVVARLEGRSKRFGIAAAALATIGLFAGIVAVVLVPVDDPNAISGTVGIIAASTNALSILTPLVAALLVGVATVRAGVLPRLVAWTLIVIGVATAPILFVSPLPVLPQWATDTLAFLLSGVGFTVIGAIILRLNRQGI